MQVQAHPRTRIAAISFATSGMPTPQLYGSSLTSTFRRISQLLGDSRVFGLDWGFGESEIAGTTGRVQRGKENGVV